MADVDRYDHWDSTPSEVGSRRDTALGLEEHQEALSTEELDRCGNARSLINQVVVHRPVLNSRKKVANFARAFSPLGSSRDYLRAFFVDSECSFISSSLIADCDTEIDALNVCQVLEAGFVAGASGITLARGISNAKIGLSSKEIMKAKEIFMVAERERIFLLDYIVVKNDSDEGVFAIHKRNRINDDA